MWSNLKKSLIRIRFLFLPWEANHLMRYITIIYPNPNRTLTITTPILNGQDNKSWCISACMYANALIWCFAQQGLVVTRWSLSALENDIVRLAGHVNHGTIEEKIKNLEFWYLKYWDGYMWLQIFRFGKQFTILVWLKTCIRHFGLGWKIFKIY